MSERTYKMCFKPAEWVPPKEAEAAKEFYRCQYDRLTKLVRDGINDEYGEIYYKAIEIFCTDEKLKDVWKIITKTGYDGYMIMSRFGGIFFGYHLGPRITETERNNRLEVIDTALKNICSLTLSDWSVRDYVSQSLLATMSHVLDELSELNPDHIQKFSRRSYPLLAIEPSLFFSKLRDEIKECKINTHAPYPRNIGNKKTAERVYFIHNFTDLVDFIYSYRRSNYAMTARILNKIRPDLGNFSADNIRQTTKGRSKPKSMQKKAS